MEALVMAVRQNEQLRKRAIQVAALVSLALMFVQWGPLVELVHRLSQFVILLVALGTLDCLLVFGLALMLAGYGTTTARAVRRAIKERQGVVRPLLASQAPTRMVWVGFWVSSCAAWLFFFAGAIGMVLVIPPAGWGLGLGLVIDFGITVLRTTSWLSILQGASDRVRIR